MKKTLSTLIKECGDNFRNLTKDEKLWRCNYWEAHWENEDGVGEDDCGEDSIGETPEEAVENLLKTL